MTSHPCRMRLFIMLLFAGVFLSGPVLAEPPDRQCSSGAFGHQHCVREAYFAFDTCQILQTVSENHGINPYFFTRLIWQESRFDPYALSPANAQGIAQFIPSTAKLRKLKDAFNPAEALDFSAQYLAELQQRFGNAGLAAVAYNGGENRAERFIKGVGGLPRETRNYVRIITGMSAEVWRDDPPEALDLALDKDLEFQQACLGLAKKRKISPLIPATPRLHNYGVQIAYGLTPAAADRKFKANTKSCRVLAQSASLEFVFVKNRASPIKGYYMARLGANDRRQASKLCNSLRKAGCVCAVFRN
ncbi:MAG: lytic transglycosylase domain-containing protein [Pseudoruegeria sp.]